RFALRPGLGARRDTGWFIARKTGGVHGESTESDAAGDLGRGLPVAPGGRVPIRKEPGIVARDGLNFAARRCAAAGPRLAQFAEGAAVLLQRFGLLPLAPLGQGGCLAFVPLRQLRGALPILFLDA